MIELKPITGWRLLLSRAEIDCAVLYGLLARIWQAGAGIVSLLLIIRFFAPDVQGFYYTFASLLALQSFVELGLYLVIINIASHEWARLGLDEEGRIVGSAEAHSRLVGLGRFVFKWYAVASLIFIIAAGVIGYGFFDRNDTGLVQWRAPWIAVVCLTGVILWTLPFISLLEGCNQVASVNRFRLLQAITINLVLWIAVALGGDLWALVASAGATLGCALYFLLVHRRTFLGSFYRRHAGAGIRWKVEIWPMQWRLALQGVVNYFLYSLFNPIMFHYHGPVVAGQMGMTWQIVSTLQLLALTWLQAKVPQFGILIARKDYAVLDNLWLRATTISLIFISVSGGAIWLAVYLLNVTQLSFANRLLEPLPTGLLVLAVILMQVIQCQAAYLRAHKKEPLTVVGVVSGVTSGVLVWMLGSRYGATGAAAAFLLAVLLVSTPLVTYLWFTLRKQWHE